MLLSVIFMFGKEISFLQCAKMNSRTLHSSWNYLKMEVPILCDPFFFPAKKHYFQLSDTLTNKLQQIQAWNCVNFVFNSLELGKKIPFLNSHSQYKHSVCGVGKSHLLRVDHMPVHAVNFHVGNLPSYDRWEVCTFHHHRQWRHRLGFNDRRL